MNYHNIAIAYAAIGVAYTLHTNYEGLRAVFSKSDKKLDDVGRIAVSEVRNALDDLNRILPGWATAFFLAVVVILTSIPEAVVWPYYAVMDRIAK